ncbi:kinetochore scaffold 1 isoform X2 [Siniperca chuatsi]|uniref:kinetochore scaffold 1 isoform X2 n=1 Tax=Siniperca chuatsi TaxID=119488 RepID=UPI001CE201AF|nr:kinetochore scaffold 1 isoform X2 [Siniperca chuatsi]
MWWSVPNQWKRGIQEESVLPLPMMSSCFQIFSLYRDIKNASPARSPLQELITTTTEATQNRVRVAITEDGIQQITGMETLLNAPLHASQQRDKVNFDTGADFGEKTVMFSTDDAFMDMTHSHTINIAGDADLLADISLQNYNILPSSGEKTVMFTADDGSMDMTLSHTLNMLSGSTSLPTSRNMDLSVEKGNISSSVPCLDPGFENFLASLSKPGGPSVNPVITRMTPPTGGSSEETNGSLAQIKTQRADVDKENQAPTSVSAVMEKSLNTSRKIGESSYGSALYPEGDLSMGMTEAQTGRIQGFTDDDDDDDDPFQCLFPTQEMYSHLDNRVSQTAQKTKQQQSSKPLASFNPKDMTSLKNPTLNASHERPKVNLDAKDEGREKTIMFTAGDEFMDMTQSHTVNIASGSLAPPNQTFDIFLSGKMENASSLEERKREACGLPGSSANGLDLGFKNFLVSLSKPSAPSDNPAASSRSFGESYNGGAICPEYDVSMDMTEAQTGRINGLTGSDDPFQLLFPTQDMYPLCENLKSAEMDSGQQHREVLGSSNCTGMETSLQPSLKTKGQRHQVKFDAEDDSREKTVRFSADDACMDVTRSHTVNIATDFGLQSLQNLDFLPTCGEKTARFSENDAAINIASKLVSDSVPPVKKQEGETCGLPRNRSSSAHSLDPGFNNLLTSLSKQSDLSFNPVIPRMTPTAAQSSNIGDSSNGGTICPEDDVSMDMTEAQTGHILGITGTDDLQCLFPTQDTYPQSGEAEMTSQQQHSEALGSSNRKGMETSLTAPLKLKVQRHQVKLDAEDDCREKTVRFTTDEACMDVTQSHTVNIATNLEPQSHQNVGLLPPWGEKTVRFTANDACMDVTQSHTVNIATNLEPQSHQNVDFLPSLGEKTVRFTVNDAAMDVTRSHTVNIATNLEPQSRQNVDFLPSSGEKTVRFTANDAAMDVTRSHTVNIATNLEPQSHQNLGLLPPWGEKTVRFTANDACMDVTQSHTVNIATNLEPQSHQNVDLLPPTGEKTVRFTANDAAMDVTRSHTVNIASNSVSDSFLPHQDSNVLSTLSVKKRENETCRPRRNRSSSARTLDPGLYKTSGPWANPVITKAVAPASPSPQEIVNTNGFLDQLKTQKPDVDIENEAPGFVSAGMEKPVNKTMTDCPEDDVSMDMTGAQTAHILGQTYTDEPPQCLSSTQDLYPNSDDLKKTEVTSQQSNEALGSSSPNGVQMTNCPYSLDSNETDTRKEPRNQNCSQSAVDHDVDAVPSRKSRRISLADLHSKVRRLSHMINTAPVTTAMDSCTAPMPQLEHDMGKNSKDKTESLPVMEPDLKRGLVNTEENTQAQCLMQGEQPSSTTTTPFNLKTKQLMSRLSVGGFKPKLPQRNKPDDPKKVNSVGEHTRSITVNVTNQLSNFDNDVSDIYDEELGSCEDMSEMLDTRSPQKATEKVSPSQEFNMDEPLEDHVFEQDSISAVYGNKRPLPVDDNDMEDEKRMKASTETATDFEMGLQSHVAECDGNITTAPTMTAQTTDYCNSSHTASIRCEATFESTFKQSLFESQLEDYANDVQRKLDDGTITVLEFFKLFNIDFVIHNPRQSVLPGRLLSDTDHTPMDLLKDRHINRPKQMVYETNVLNLTENVEGLKERMQGLDKPLKIVNRPLWEEMRNSSEKELKSFGAKLKERNNLFRKMSKVQSHEMKEVLYSNLVQANLDEQQSLRGTIKKADEMIKSLDDCIRKLETELTAVEEKGFEDTPSLKSRQKEMQKVTEALADNDRQISELEMQNKQNSDKLKRLKAETRNLENHVTVLHWVNEWKFGEKRDNCAVYTFLHETFHLQLVYDKSNGNDADNRSERKISHIAFKLQLDDEKSQCHACLVHKLLSQYINGETSWVEKYPTSRHVPKLLHDVGLVVSRCRLLGEELRLLKMWGGLRLDILNISCVDTQVHIVFSSLKKFSKFEVIFSVRLTNHLCVLQVQSFKNMIGNTTIQQIEEIVASFSPAKNFLTKIVKKIHENLLC